MNKDEVVTHEGIAEAHHVLEVDEGVIDGCDFDALLQAGPQDQTTDTAKAEHGQKERQKDTYSRFNLPQHIKYCLVICNNIDTLIIFQVFLYIQGIL